MMQIFVREDRCRGWNITAEPEHIARSATRNSLLTSHFNRLTAKKARRVSRAFSCAPVRYVQSDELPDLRAQRVGSHHRVSGLASECLRELRHVRQRAVHPPARRRVRIREHLLTFGLGARLRSPDLRP